MVVTVSLSHVVSATPCPSVGGLLTFCPCSSVRSLSRETVLHKLLQYESFPQAAALHDMPQHGSFLRGAVLQEQAAPAWVPHGVTSPASKPAPGVGSSLHGSAGPGRSLLQHGARHGVTASFRHPPAPAWGPFHGLQVHICSTVDLHGLQGDNLPHHGLHHELQGKSLCSDISGTSFPLLLHRPWCLQSCFFHIISLLSPHCCFTTGFFLPLLKYVITELLPLSLIGLASGRSVLQPAGTGFIRHGGSFWQLLTEATPIGPPLPKPFHGNPQHVLH